MDFSKKLLIFVMIAIFASMAKTAKINILKFFFFQNKESHIGASNIEKWFQKSNHFVDYLKLPYLFLFFTFCVSKETYQGKIWRNLKKCVYPRSLFVTDHEIAIASWSWWMARYLHYILVMASSSMLQRSFQEWPRTPKVLKFPPNTFWEWYQFYRTEIWEIMRFFSHCYHTITHIKILNFFLHKMFQEWGMSHLKSQFTVYFV